MFKYDITHFLTFSSPHSQAFIEFFYCDPHTFMTIHASCVYTQLLQDPLSQVINRADTKGHDNHGTTAMIIRNGANF